MIHLLLLIMVHHFIQFIHYVYLLVYYQNLPFNIFLLFPQYSSKHFNTFYLNLPIKVIIWFMDELIMFLIKLLVIMVYLRSIINFTFLMWLWWCLLSLRLLCISKSFLYLFICKIFFLRWLYLRWTGYLLWLHKDISLRWLSNSKSIWTLKVSLRWLNDLAEHWLRLISWCNVWLSWWYNRLSICWLILWIVWISNLWNLVLRIDRWSPLWCIPSILNLWSISIWIEGLRVIH